MKNEYPVPTSILQTSVSTYGRAVIAAMNRHSRSLAVLAVGALLVVATAFYLGINSNTWLISPDSTLYLEGAQSLIQLKGFVYENGRPITSASPGTSALYSIPLLIPSDGFYFPNLLAKLAAVGFIGLTLGVMRRSVNLGLALLIGLFLAFSQTLMTESTFLLSDILFSFLLMLTLYLFPSEKTEQMNVKSALILGGLLSWCYLIRGIGLSIFIGYIAFIALKTQKHRARTLLLVSGVFFLPALILALRARYFHANDSYFQLALLKRDWELDSGTAGFLDWYERITTNIIVLARLIAYMFTNGADSRASKALIGALLGLGFMSQAKNSRSTLHFAILFFYISMLLLKSGDLPDRYLLPVIPLLALFVVQGARQLWLWLQNSWARHCLLVTFLLFVFFNPYWRNGYLHAKQVWSDSHQRVAPIEYPGHARFIELVERHRPMLTETDIVATMHPRILRRFLPAAIRVNWLPFTHKVDQAFAEIQAANITYLYCDKTNQQMWRYIESMIKKYPSPFTVVYENSGGVIYKMDPLLAGRARGL